MQKLFDLFFVLTDVYQWLQYNMQCNTFSVGGGGGGKYIWHITDVRVSALPGIVYNMTDPVFHHCYMNGPVFWYPCLINLIFFAQIFSSETKIVIFICKFCLQTAKRVYKNQRTVYEYVNVLFNQVLWIGHFFRRPGIWLGSCQWSETRCFTFVMSWMLCRCWRFLLSLAVLCYAVCDCVISWSYSLFLLLHVTPIVRIVCEQKAVTRVRLRECAWAYSLVTCDTFTRVNPWVTNILTNEETLSYLKQG